LFNLKKSGIADYIYFFISDRDKGLINAVGKLFPDVPHAKCLRHLAENFPKIFDESITTLLKFMALANTKSVHDYYREQIYEKAGEKALEWIDNATPYTWCRSLFPTSRYGVTTSNTIEIVFATLLRANHLTFLHILLFIERYVLEKRFIAYQTYQQMVDDGQLLVPVAVNFINHETEKSTHLRCVPTGHFTATVEDVTPSEVQNYSLSLASKNCTCNRYKENELPCRHVICFLRNVQREVPSDYAASMYKTTTIVNMYQSVDGTCSRATTLDDLHKLGMTDMIPPPVKVKKGRKRVKRYQSKNKRRGGCFGPRTCPKCGEKGHFEKGCHKKVLVCPPSAVEQDVIVEVEAEAINENDNSTETDEKSTVSNENDDSTETE
jgi:Transposase, Mutator family/SWIM zinc finger